MKKLAQLSAFAAVLAAASGVAVSAQAEGSTGTDPRDFTSKLMPYGLYTKLENDVEVRQLNLFGMYAFTPDIAITYDLPVYKEVDISDANIPLPPFGPNPGGGGGPAADIPADGSASSIGDLGLRFFYKPKALQFETSSHMMGVEVTLPTATKDVTGGDAWILSPMYVYVRNVNLISPGFVAFMNFLDFDVAKESGVEDTLRFRGRWFLMQPLTKPGPNLFDGLYLLPEIQPVYDFKENEFSLWAAPEIGKALPWGAVYAKPGFGISNNQDSDRDWTFEVGFRYFF